LLARTGRTFQVVQRIAVGRIPEGVAFSPDGRHLVVQCHPDRELWVFAVRGQAVEDAGLRLAVPGMPSSLRAAPR
jgi:sugar lactone lactonase YvrE